MKQSERLEIIIDMLQKNGNVKVAELSRLMDCSEVTIRTDIRKLDEQGVLKKTYGGAVQKEEGLTVSFSPGEFFLNGTEKQRIVQKAYEYIDNRNSIIIDDSTTGCYLAKYIKEHPEKHLIVVTNSLYAAAILSSAKHVELFIVGGQPVGTPPSTLDSFAIQAFQNFNVDKAFVGVNGINLKAGLTSIGTPQMETKRAMIKSAAQTYVIADSSKFGSSNLFTVCPMSDIHLIITDNRISKELLQTAQKNQISIVTV
ncbi:DeoR/GlpR family DNA-binding transcription regulator [Roseburia hominis]